VVEVDFLVALRRILDDKSGQQHSLCVISFTLVTKSLHILTFFNLRHAPHSGFAMSHALRRCLHVKHPERVRVTFLLFLVTLPGSVPISFGG
jgi:hypothetical protein